MQPEMSKAPFSPTDLTSGRQERFVRPSVCPVGRQQQRSAAGLLLSAGTLAADIRRWLRAPALKQQMRVAMGVRT